jgi:hypothetical protein
MTNFQWVTFFWPSKFGKLTRNTFFWGHIKTSQRNHTCQNKEEISAFIHTSSGVPYTLVCQAAKLRGWVTHGIHFISDSDYIISSTHLHSRCVTNFRPPPHKIQDSSIFPFTFVLLLYGFYLLEMALGISCAIPCGTWAYNISFSFLCFYRQGIKWLVPSCYSFKWLIFIQIKLFLFQSLCFWVHVYMCVHVHMCVCMCIYIE